MITNTAHEAERLISIKWGPRGESISIWTNYGLKQKLYGASREVFEQVLIGALKAVADAEKAARADASPSSVEEAAPSPNA